MLTSPSITQRLETITPDRARSMLEKNEHNRKVSPHLVRAYAEAMLSGRWRLNGETIKIGRNGEALDGQHRLLACVQSQIPLVTFVVYNLDPDTFDTIDIGKKRTGGDILGIEGYKNATALSAAVRWITVLESGKRAINTIRMAPDEIRLRLAADPEIESSVTFGLRARKVLAPGIAGALHFLFRRKDEEAARCFFIDLGSGALPSGDSVLALRERLISDRLKKSKLDAEEIIALSIRAWNHRRSDHQTRTLKGVIVAADGTRSFPAVI